MKTLVLGLGNPILSDDGVGFQVARELKTKIDQQEVTVEETSMSGLSLLDMLIGYDKAIIIDAIKTVGGKVGQIYQLDNPGAFSSTRHATSLHDVNLATALELGNKLGLALPQQIIIFAIEVADTSTFSEKCTSRVKQAIPGCLEMIIKELKGGNDA